MSDVAKGAADFTVYAIGGVHASVCTTLSPEEATARINEEWPTGIDSPWAVTEKKFRTGEPNPCPCNDHPETHRHFLFTC